MLCVARAFESAIASQGSVRSNYKRRTSYNGVGISPTCSSYTCNIDIMKNQV